MKKRIQIFILVSALAPSLIQAIPTRKARLITGAVALCSASATGLTWHLNSPDKVKPGSLQAVKLLAEEQQQAITKCTGYAGATITLITGLLLYRQTPSAVTRRVTNMLPERVSQGPLMTRPWPEMPAAQRRTYSNMLKLQVKLNKAEGLLCQAAKDFTVDSNTPGKYLCDELREKVRDFQRINGRRIWYFENC